MAEEKTAIQTSSTDDSAQHASVAAANPHKRKQTTGEILFNLSTYGGVTWILNEALSSIAYSAIKPADGAKKAGFLHDRMKGAVDFLHTNVNPLKLKREWIAYPISFLALTSGGNALVPLVKWLEDRKGELVRKADNMIHGEKGKKDPELIAAHNEMDKTPKQTWQSLWEGRLLVMFLALGIDLGISHENSPTTKLFKNTKFEKYSNLERAGATLTRDLLSWAHPDASKRAAIKEMRANSFMGEHFKGIQPKEGKLAEIMGGTYGFVMIFSVITSALFYASSHAFARNHEKKFEKRVDKLEKAFETSTVSSNTNSTDQEQNRDTPNAKVTQVSERSQLDDLQTARAV